MRRSIFPSVLSLMSMAAVASMEMTVPTRVSVPQEPDESEAPPRRLSIEKESPFYAPRVARRIDVYLDGHKRPYDVAEYSVDDGWLRTTTGRELRGVVEARWRPAPPRAAPPDPVQTEAASASRLAAAEAKRARKAAKALRMNGRAARHG